MGSDTNSKKGGSRSPRQDRGDLPKVTEEHEGLPGYLGDPPLEDPEDDLEQPAEDGVP